MKFLLDEAAAEPGVTQWILPAVLLILVIGIFILNYFRSKKNQENMKNIVSSLKVGDNVKTYSGLYGKILEIIETTDGKVAVLETGTEKNRGIFSIDINAVYGIDEKQPVVYDAEGNVIDANVSVEDVKPVEDDTVAEKLVEETVDKPTEETPVVEKKEVKKTKPRTKKETTK